MLEKVCTKFVWARIRIRTQPILKSDPYPDKNRPDPQHWYRSYIFQAKYLSDKVATLSVICCTGSHF
jgi:hypothetical protein